MLSVAFFPHRSVGSRAGALCIGSKVKKASFELMALGCWWPSANNGGGCVSGMEVAVGVLQSWVVAVTMALLLTMMAIVVVAATCCSGGGVAAC